MLQRKTQRSDEFSADVLALLQPLFGTALRLTRNRADAEDLVQETFLKAIRFSNRFVRGTDLRAWLFTILHNTFRNARRGAARNPVEVDSPAVELASSRDGSDETPESSLLGKVLDADVKAALDTLPDVFRQAVWLRDVEEFTYAEIAAMLDVPIGTVMSRISRGRRLLFERLTG